MAAAVCLATMVGYPMVPAAETAVAASPPSAARPVVATSAYALAQLTSYIGGKAVNVVDLAPPGAQPQGLPLTASGRSTH